MVSFQEDLAFSNSHNDMWDSLYAAAFPDLVSIARVPGNNAAQKAGIDTVLVLKSGAVLRVDEKLSRKIRPNFFLEYSAHQKPGWLEKELHVDIIAYAFLPNRTAYMLPYPALRKAWDTHKEAWKTKYNKITSTASGAVVPIEEVLQAIQEATKVTV